MLGPLGANENLFQNDMNLTHRGEFCSFDEVHRKAFAALQWTEV